MKKSDRIIVAALTIALGFLLVVLQSDIVSILTTVLGITLVVFGCIELFRNRVPPAVVKIVSGALLVLCGWVVVNAVVYILAAAVLLVGVLSLYETLKAHATCLTLWQTISAYAVPSLLVLIGVILFFCGNEESEWVYVCSGVLTTLLGGVLLADAFIGDG